MLNRSYESWLKFIVIVCGIYFLGKVTQIYFPVIISIILAFVLNPVVDFLANQKILPNIMLNRGAAVLLSFLGAILVIIMIGSFVFLPFIHQFDKFIIDLPALITRIQELALKIEARANMLELPSNVNTIINQAIASAASFSADLARRFINGLFGFATSIVELVVVPVLTYYFLRDWKLLREKVITLFAVESRGRVRKIIEEMAKVISGYIRGQVITSIIVGLIVFCGMYLLEVDYPLVLGLLATCTETIPIIGPIIGAIPAIMLAYLGSPALAVKVVCFYIVVHQLENHIVVPNIMGHTINLHPVFIIISLLVGGQLLGIIGMMIAVPVAALLRVVMKELWNTER